MEKGWRAGMRVCWRACACASLCRCVPAHVFLCVKRGFLHISQLCQHYGLLHSWNNYNTQGQPPGGWERGGF